MATKCKNVDKARGKPMYNARANWIGMREGEGRRGYQGEERCVAQESNAIAI